MLNSIISSEGITLKVFFICSLASVILGLISAIMHRYKNNPSRSFSVTIALMPFIVQTVIMMVNGNLGAGIAVAGAFSLVRFRSVPGSARDICFVFLCCATGLATGTGFVVVAAILTLIVCLLSFLYFIFPFADQKNSARTLKITVSEDMDYENDFKGVFDKYTSSYSLKRIQTVNLGSLFRLQYDIVLKSGVKEMEFINDLRCCNGNLDIICGAPEGESGL